MTHVKHFYFPYEYEQFTASESIFIFVYFMLLAASRRPPLATHVTPHVISDRAAPIDKDGGCYILIHNTTPQYNYTPSGCGVLFTSLYCPKGHRCIVLHSVTHFYAKWRMGITLYNRGTTY